MRCNTTKQNKNKLRQSQSKRKKIEFMKEYSKSIYLEIKSRTLTIFITVRIETSDQENTATITDKSQ